MSNVIKFWNFRKKFIKYRRKFAEIREKSSIFAR